MVKAELGRRVTVAVCLSASWAALAGVADLDAAQEVSQTNGEYNKLDPNIGKYSRSMHELSK